MRIYTYRTTLVRADRYLAEVVCREDGEPDVVVSRQTFEDRNRAYRYAKHMARCMGRNYAWLN